MVENKALQLYNEGIHWRCIYVNLGENLQNLRKQKGMSQEELANLLDVSRQAISKWESNGTLPETENLIALCEIFHCSMDELVKGIVKEEVSTDKVTYDKLMNRFSKNMSLGILFILIGVTFFLLILGFTPSPTLKEKYTFLGIIILLSFTAISVPLFIVNGLALEHFKEKNPTLPNFYKEEEIEKNHHQFSILIATGVSIILIGLILFIASMALQIFKENEIFAVTIFMIFITISVPIFVYAGIQKSKYDITTYNKVLKKEQKESEELIGKISAVIMILTTMIYFVLGFLFDLWNLAWIVFPIGGMACGIVSIIFTKEN